MLRSRLEEQESLLMEASADRRFAAARAAMDKWRSEAIGLRRRVADLERELMDVSRAADEPDESL